MNKIKLIYSADPMCSWCWGISADMQKLLASYGAEIDFEMRMGGLRTGGDVVVDEAMQKFLLHHWQAVHQRTKQKFDTTILMQLGWIYNTEPACRAVIVAQKLQGQHPAFSFFQTLQQAFYCDGIMITDENILCDLAQQQGFNRDDFKDLLEREEIKADTQQEFIDVRARGITSFPTVQALFEGNLIQIAHGYESYRVMKERIDGISSVLVKI